MSADLLIQLGTKGAETIIKATKDALEKAIKDKGENQVIGFPETNYYLPLINALLKLEVKVLFQDQQIRQVVLIIGER